MVDAQADHASSWRDVMLCAVARARPGLRLISDASRSLLD
jgi:hypothetical protein